MIVKRVEQHRIDKNNPLFKKADALCFNAKNVYNQATFHIRQEFIRTNKEHEADETVKVTIPSTKDLYNAMIDGEARGDMTSRPYSLILREIADVWKAFFKSCNEYKKCPNKYTGRPKLPGYLDKENGRFIFTADDNPRGKGITECENGYIRFSLKDLADFNGVFKTHVTDYDRICQVRIVPKPNKKPQYYNLELVFDIEVPNIEENFLSKRIAAIDPGVNNLVTIATNFGTSPVIVNGKPLKSINHYYNKELARMKTELAERNGRKTSKRIQSLTNKRNAKIENYMHRVSKMVVEYLVENEVDTLVIGHNTGWKNKKKEKEEEQKKFLTKAQKNAEKRNNQNFYQIPHTQLFHMIAYKAENKGIVVISREEAYTSGTSFLDYEKPTKENYKPERRIHRGLFITNHGKEINADVNAAYQILVKEFPNAIKDRHSVEINPVIMNIDGPYS